MTELLGDTHGVHTADNPLPFALDAGGPDSWIILCDFDGTISLRDVTDRLLENFGKPGCETLENAWEAGHIGSRECMRGQIALLDASRADMDNCLDSVEIDPDFSAFVDLAAARGIAVRVISDGLDYAIHRILARYGIDTLPVAANHLEQVSERSWQLRFPHARSSCKQASGNCKCAQMQQPHVRRARIIFVGDGSSDFCASHVADVVLAKDRLIDYCAAQGIEYLPIHNFADALQLLPGILDNPPAEAPAHPLATPAILKVVG